jgi:hypothetical protein
MHAPVSPKRNGWVAVVPRPRQGCDLHSAQDPSKAATIDLATSAASTPRLRTPVTLMVIT